MAEIQGVQLPWNWRDFSPLGAEGDTSPLKVPQDRTTMMIVNI